MEQSLSGDTPAVQARAAKLVALNEGHLHPQPGTTQGCRVAGAAASDDNKVIAH
ncbi:hypothetical protein D9M69_724160 [compost metagenome]